MCQRLSINFWGFRIWGENRPAAQTFSDCSTHNRKLSAFGTHITAHIPLLQLCQRTNKKHQLLQNNILLSFMLVFLLTIFFAGSASQDAFGFVLSSIRSNPAMRKESSYLHLTAVTESNNGNELLLPPSVFSTIEEGRIAVIPKFLPQNEIDLLRSDAQLLWDDHRFSTDALAGYGSAGKFDPEKDRAVLRLPQWKNDSLGNFSNRQRFGSLMGSVRSELAYNLNRPNLDNGYATTMYGKGSTEISYTRFGPGAFLKRHVGKSV